MKPLNMDKAGELESGVFYQVVHTSKEEFLPRAPADRDYWARFPFGSNKFGPAFGLNYGPAGNIACSCSSTFGICAAGPEDWEVDVSENPLIDRFINLGGGWKAMGLQTVYSSFGLTVASEKVQELYATGPLYGVSLHLHRAYRRQENGEVSDWVVGIIMGSQGNLFTKWIASANADSCPSCGAPVSRCEECGFWTEVFCTHCGNSLRLAAGDDCVIDGEKWRGEDVITGHFQGRSYECISRRLVSRMMLAGLGPVTLRPAYIRTDRLTGLGRDFLELNQNIEFDERANRGIAFCD